MFYTSRGFHSSGQVGGGNFTSTSRGGGGGGTHQQANQTGLTICTNKESGRAKLEQLSSDLFADLQVVPCPRFAYPGSGLNKPVSLQLCVDPTTHISCPCPDFM